MIQSFASLFIARRCTSFFTVSATPLVGIYIVYFDKVAFLHKRMKMMKIILCQLHRWKTWWTVISHVRQRKSQRLEVLVLVFPQTRQMSLIRIKRCTIFREQSYFDILLFLFSTCGLSLMALESLICSHPFSVFSGLTGGFLARDVLFPWKKDRY